MALSDDKGTAVSADDIRNIYTAAVESGFMGTFHEWMNCLCGTNSVDSAHTQSKKIEQKPRDDGLPVFESPFVPTFINALLLN
jgi:hypothetical protein